MAETGKTIRADPARLQEAAQTICLTVRELEKELSVMDGQVGRLRQWEGEAGRIFFKKYRETAQEAVEAARALSNCARSLQRIAGSYQETEEGLKLEAGQLPADVWQMVSHYSEDS